jgi:hypothetical protein
MMYAKKIEDLKIELAKLAILMNQTSKFDSKSKSRSNLDLKETWKNTCAKHNLFNLQIEMYTKLDKYNLSKPAFDTATKLLKQFDLSKLKSGYSMGEILTLYVCEMQVNEHDNRQDYSNSCKFKPAHGYLSVNISKDLAKELLNYDYFVIGGVQTLVERTKSKIKKCFWLLVEGSKQNAQMHLKRGYVTNNFHAKTEIECIEWREQQLTLLKKERTIKYNKSGFLKKFVGLNHSIIAGNCKIGTEQFANRHNLNIEEGYRLDYILSLENTEFTNRLFRSL